MEIAEKLVVNPAVGVRSASGLEEDTELGAHGLVDLVDVEKLTLPDPGVLLVNTALTEAEPEAVLAVDAVAQALTTDMLLDLQAQVAGGGTVPEVADRWLQEQGLA